MINSEKVTAVIVAAGSSERMDGIDKIFTPFAGKPVLARSIAVFEACPQVDNIVIVVAAGNIASGQKLVAQEGWQKVSIVCTGGERRQDSVACGLEVVPQCSWVVVHDGARPLVKNELIVQGLAAARETGAAVAAVAVRDTIKVADSSNQVEKTLVRSELRAIQTPQVFRYELLRRAHLEAAEMVTDDAMLVEKLGVRVKLYDGSYDNIKITTPEDLVLAKAIWRENYGDEAGCNEE